MKMVVVHMPCMKVVPPSATDLVTQALHAWDLSDIFRYFG